MLYNETRCSLAVLFHLYCNSCDYSMSFADLLYSWKGFYFLYWPCVKFILLYIVSLTIRQISYNYVIFHEGDRHYQLMRII